MGVPFCGAGRTWGGGLRGWTSFSVGALLENLVGGSSTGPCEGTFFHRGPVKYHGGSAHQEL